MIDYEFCRCGIVGQNPADSFQVRNIPYCQHYRDSLRYDFLHMFLASCSGCENDSIHAVFHKSFRERSQLACIFIGAPEQDNVAVFSCQRLYPSGNVGKKRICDVRDDDAYSPFQHFAQAHGRFVGVVTKLRNGIKDSFRRLWVNGAIGCAVRSQFGVHHARDERCGDACLGGDIFYGGLFHDANI